MHSTNPIILFHFQKKSLEFLCSFFVLFLLSLFFSFFLFSFLFLHINFKHWLYQLLWDRSRNNFKNCSLWKNLSIQYFEYVLDKLMFYVWNKIFFECLKVILLFYLFHFFFTFYRKWMILQSTIMIEHLQKCMDLPVNIFIKQKHFMKISPIRMKK